MKEKRFRLLAELYKFLYDITQLAKYKDKFPAPCGVI